MLIDWDNLQICHSRDAPGTDLDLQALIALAQSYGTLVSARAYAEWNLLSERLAVYKAGIEPVFAPVMRPEGSPREGKSLADTVMVADGVDLLWTVAPDVFVLATSDKDMIPLARIAKQRGAAVVVLGSDLTAIPLVEMSNVFITYRQLLRELDRVSELEAPVGRAPARERRLRESRRPSSEPYGGGLGRAPSALARSGLVDGRPPARWEWGRQRPPRCRSRRPGRHVGDTTSQLRHRARRNGTCPAGPGPAAARQVLAEDLPSDEAGIGAGDLGPRRRRRRGGRGRRTGIGGVGDADIQAEALQDMPDDTDEGDGSEVDRSTAAASAASPDDIDTAVLQLLASRDRGDRESTPAADEGERSEEPTAASSFTAPVPSPFAAPDLTEDSARTERPAPATPRRVARTSFSSFGPPDVPVRPTRDRGRNAQVADSGSGAASVEAEESAGPTSPEGRSLSPSRRVSHPTPSSPRRCRSSRLPTRHSHSLHLSRLTRPWTRRGLRRPWRRRWPATPDDRFARGAPRALARLGERDGRPRVCRGRQRAFRHKLGSGHGARRGRPGWW